MTVDAVKQLEAMKTALTALEPLEPEGRMRAVKWIAETLGVGDAVDATTTTRSEAPTLNLDEFPAVSEMTPKQFIAIKKPKTDVERITCLAYYLTHARDTLHFKTADLTALNQEAAGLRFTNASQGANNAMNQNGYLAPAGGGKRQITPRGEALVEALPDREAVNAALAEHPKKARRTRKTTPKAAPKALPSG